MRRARTHTHTRLIDLVVGMRILFVSNVLRCANFEFCKLFRGHFPLSAATACTVRCRTLAHSHLKTNCQTFPWRISVVVILLLLLLLRWIKYDCRRKSANDALTNNNRNISENPSPADATSHTTPWRIKFDGIKPNWIKSNRNDFVSPDANAALERTICAFRFSSIYFINYGTVASQSLWFFVVVVASLQSQSLSRIDSNYSAWPATTTICRFWFVTTHHMDLCHTRTLSFFFSAVSARFLLSCWPVMRCDRCHVHKFHIGEKTLNAVANKSDERKKSRNKYQLFRFFLFVQLSLPLHLYHCHAHPPLPVAFSTPEERKVFHFFKKRMNEKISFALYDDDDVCARLIVNRRKRQK